MAVKVSTAITEFADFATFDYHSLYPNNKLFDVFAPPWVPFLLVFLYLVLSKPVCNILISVLGIKPDRCAVSALLCGVMCGSICVYAGADAESVLPLPQQGSEGRCDLPLGAAGGLLRMDLRQRCHDPVQLLQL